MGPLPYSARQPDPPAPLPPTPALVDWLVDAIDRWWTEAGRPDPWTVVEVGAGDGRRAAEVLARGPECLTALRYVLVAQDPAAREAHRSVLPIEAPSLLLGPIVPSDPDDPHDPDDPGRPLGGIGPLITSLSDAPVLQGPGLVLAVGWLSGLPSGRVEWRDGRWWDVLLAAGPGDAGFTELTVPVPPERTPQAAKLVAGPRDGARYATFGAAIAWVADMLGTAESGRLAVVDRWTARTEPVPPERLPPLALDQLATVRRPREVDPLPLPVPASDGSDPLALVSWALG
jgi:hypothetical protein